MTRILSSTVFWIMLIGLISSIGLLGCSYDGTSYHTMKERLNEWVQNHNPAITNNTSTNNEQLPVADSETENNSIPTNTSNETDNKVKLSDVLASKEPGIYLQYDNEDTVICLNSLMGSGPIYVREQEPYDITGGRLLYISTDENTFSGDGSIEDFPPYALPVLQSGYSLLQSCPFDSFDEINGQSYSTKEEAIAILNQAGITYLEFEDGYGYLVSPVPDTQLQFGYYEGTEFNEGQVDLDTPVYIVDAEITREDNRSLTTFPNAVECTFGKTKDGYFTINTDNLVPGVYILKERLGDFSIPIRIS